MEPHGAQLAFDIQKYLGDGVDPDPRVGAETVRADHAGGDAALIIAGGFAFDADLFEELCDLLGFAFGKGAIQQGMAAEADKKPNKNNEEQRNWAGHAVPVGKGPPA
jgi:hypothetical protein